MFELISTGITNTLKRHLSNIDENKEEVIRYGLNILIYQISVFAFIFFLAAALGISKYIILTLTVYGALRVCAGGAHAQTRTECFLITNITLFGTVYLAKSIHLHSYYPSLFLYIASLLCIHLYAPADTTEKPILSTRIKRYQKNLSFILATVVFALAVVLYQQDTVQYNIITLASIPFLFQLTPLGYKLLRCKHSYEAVPGTV